MSSRSNAVLVEADFGNSDLSSLIDRSDGPADGGERRLMAALLTDGIEAYIASFRAALRNPTQILNASDSPFETGIDACEPMSVRFAEARQWVDEMDEGYVFSFNQVCQSLGIDPNYLRIGLARYIDALQSADEGSRSWKRIRRPRSS